MLTLPVPIAVATSVKSVATAAPTPTITVNLDPTQPMLSPDAIVASYPLPEETTQPSDFLVDLITTVKNIGGLSTLLKISAIIALLVSSMKVSSLNALVWDKLGKAKVWVGPALGLLAGILGLGAAGAPLSVALVVTYVTAGGGAIFVHEILDLIKAIPGLGPVYVRVIEIIEINLGGPARANFPK
jgi:hypothetical protein